MVEQQQVHKKALTTVTDTQNSPEFLQTRPFASGETQVNSHVTSNHSSNLSHSFGNLAPQASTNSVIQPKLTIGQPGDKYEQEADRVAADVVQRINQPQVVPFRQEEEQLQMKSLSNSIQLQEIAKEEEIQTKSLLQRRPAINATQASTDLESSINYARGTGKALDVGLQKSMGQAMGADFSKVRVHTDAQSDQLNKSIQAKAFTTGQDIFFSKGAYNPKNRSGQELIAHELTHVIQQNGSSVQKVQASPVNLSTGKLVQRTTELERQQEGKNIKKNYKDQRKTIGGVTSHSNIAIEEAKNELLKTKNKRAKDLYNLLSLKANKTTALFDMVQNLLSGTPITEDAYKQQNSAPNADLKQDIRNTFIAWKHSKDPTITVKYLQKLAQEGKPTLGMELALNLGFVSTPKVNDREVLKIVESSHWNDFKQDFHNLTNVKFEFGEQKEKAIFKHGGDDKTKNRIKALADVYAANSNLENINNNNNNRSNNNNASPERLVKELVQKHVERLAAIIKSNINKVTIEKQNLIEDIEKWGNSLNNFSIPSSLSEPLKNKLKAENIRKEALGEGDIYTVGKSPVISAIPSKWNFGVHASTQEEIKNLIRKPESKADRVLNKVLQNQSWRTREASEVETLFNDMSDEELKDYLKSLDSTSYQKIEPFLNDAGNALPASLTEANKALDKLLDKLDTKLKAKQHNITEAIKIEMRTRIRARFKYGASTSVGYQKFKQLIETNESIRYLIDAARSLDAKDRVQIKGDHELLVKLKAKLAKTSIGSKDRKDMTIELANLVGLNIVNDRVDLDSNINEAKNKVVFAGSKDAGTINEEENLNREFESTELNPNYYSALIDVELYTRTTKDRTTFTRRYKVISAVHRAQMAARQKAALNPQNPPNPEQSIKNFTSTVLTGVKYQDFKNISNEEWAYLRDALNDPISNPITVSKRLEWLKKEKFGVETSSREGMVTSILQDLSGEELLLEWSNIDDFHKKANDVRPKLEELKTLQIRDSSSLTQDERDKKEKLTQETDIIIYELRNFPLSISKERLDWMNTEFSTWSSSDRIKVIEQIYDRLIDATRNDARFQAALDFARNIELPGGVKVQEREMNKDNSKDFQLMAEQTEALKMLGDTSAERGLTLTSFSAKYETRQGKKSKLVGSHRAISKNKHNGDVISEEKITEIENNRSEFKTADEAFKVMRQRAASYAKLAIGLLVQGVFAACTGGLGAAAALPLWMNLVFAASSQLAKTLTEYFIDPSKVYLRDVVWQTGIGLITNTLSQTLIKSLGEVEKFGWSWLDENPPAWAKDSKGGEFIWKQFTSTYSGIADRVTRDVPINFLDATRNKIEHGEFWKPFQQKLVEQFKAEPSSILIDSFKTSAAFIGKEAYNSVTNAENVTYEESKNRAEQDLKPKLEEALKEPQAQSNQLELEISSKAGEINTNDGKIQQTLADIGNKQSTISSNESSIQDMSKRLKELQNDSSKNATAITNLESEIRKSQESNTSLQAEINKLSTHEASLRSTNQELQLRIQTASTEKGKFDDLISQKKQEYNSALGDKDNITSEYKPKNLAEATDREKRLGAGDKIVEVATNQSVQLAASYGLAKSGQGAKDTVIESDHNAEDYNAAKVETEEAESLSSRYVHSGVKKLTRDTGTAQADFVTDMRAGKLGAYTNYGDAFTKWASLLQKANSNKVEEALPAEIGGLTKDQFNAFRLCHSQKFANLSEAKVKLNSFRGQLNDDFIKDILDQDIRSGLSISTQGDLTTAKSKWSHKLADINKKTIADDLPENLGGLTKQEFAAFRQNNFQQFKDFRSAKQAFSAYRQRP
jgi:Domain of unknown function (DUF4157)